MIFKKKDEKKEGEPNVRQVPKSQPLENPTSNIPGVIPSGNGTGEGERGQ